MNFANQLLDDIRRLINTKGYIYALCMILFEDFYINLEKIHDVDWRSRLSHKEVSLLLGFLIQNEIDFSTPNTPQELIKLKEKTYELMDKLQASFMLRPFEKLQESINRKHEIEDFRKVQKDFFGKGDMLTEPFFYSSDGVYDFQYLHFLDSKYKYDKEWLLENKKLDIGKSKNILIQIKKNLEEKSKKVRLYNLKEKLPQVIAEMRRKNPDEDWEKHAKEMLPMMEIYQYVELFFETQSFQQKLNMDNISEDGWKSFYKGLIDLFIIRKTDFEKKSDINSFFENFSVIPKKGVNLKFQGVGSFNLFNAKPIIKLDEERYFIPNSFLLFEAVYESPFYWMWEDKNYRDELSKNRGETGEDITYGLLSQVFGENRTFKSLKISTQKGKDYTDIDILCVLGSKALCVQVKSKKLTQLSRGGNDDQLKKDFQSAVQDAYKQGLKSREKLLDRRAIFLDEKGKDIQLSEEIDDVYIMVITIENIPSLNHLMYVMLDKKDEEPFPIASTIFDLELMAHYLNDPYDFLYYIKQRTSLMDHFRASEEMPLLGYHLVKKLWKNPGNRNEFEIITDSFAQLIDRNYYPLKAGLEVSDEGDEIKNRWKNENFHKLCDKLKTLDEPKITDIIFHLLDLSGEAGEKLVEFMAKTKQKTLQNGKDHTFFIPPDDIYSLSVVVTYFSLNSGDSIELRKRLLTFCQFTKYQNKADVCIGFGTLKSSYEMIDAVVFNNQEWKYDEKLKGIADEYKKLYY